MKRSKLPWTTDNNGILLGARVHDGQIIGTSIVNNKISIKIRRQDGGVAEFELNDAEEWNLSLCNGSIISTIFVWKVDSVPESTWVIPDSGWNALYGSRFKQESIKGVAAEIIKKMPESYLILFSCSYGGDIAVVCHHIAIYEEL